MTLAAAVWRLDPRPAVRPWRCPRGEDCTPGHRFTREDGAQPDECIPAVWLAPHVPESSELFDGRFDRCPEHAIRKATGLTTLYDQCDGDVTRARAFVPSMSAAFYDAWVVMSGEMRALQRDVKKHPAGVNN